LFKSTFTYIGLHETWTFSQHSDVKTAR